MGGGGALSGGRVVWGVRCQGGFSGGGGGSVGGVGGG